jgi:AcrR family transcriptional regulator
LEINKTVTSLIEVPELVEKRRGQIVAAATELFSSQGFYSTTIKDIARLAGISSGLIYQYVREKEDVLLLVLLEVVDSYAREIPVAMVGIDDPLERLVKAVHAYCRVVDRHRAATVLAYRSTKSLSPKRRELIQQRETETNDIIRRTLIDCMDRGIIRRVNIDALTYQIVLTAHGWALKSWYFKSRLSLEGYVEANLDILLNGILTQAGRRHYSDITEGTPETRSSDGMP